MTKIKQLPIKWKIGAGTWFSYLLIALLVIAFSYIKLKELSEKFSEESNAMNISMVMDILNNQNELLVATEMVDEYKENSQKEAVQKIKIIYRNVKSNSQIYPYVIDFNGLIKAHPNLEDNSNELQNLDFVKQIITKKDGFIRYTYKGEKKVAYYKTFEPWQWIVVSALAENKVYEKGNSILRGMVLIFIVIFLLMAIFNQWLVSIILKPIQVFNDIMQAIAIGDGDLTKRIKLSNKDELGKLAENFNMFSETIEQLIKKSQTTSSVVRDNSEKVQTSFTETVEAMGTIVNSINSMAEGSGSQSEQINDIKRTLDQIKQSMKEFTNELNQSSAGVNDSVNIMDEINNAIARVTADISGIAETASNNVIEAEKGTRKVDDSVSAMNAIELKVTELAQKIKVLGKSSEEIGAIINVISEISSQTNLLALNAAIEAARAGDHGKGFAVVADEVRKLAERSSSATSEISTLISQIQKVIAESVDSMEGSMNNVKQGAQLSSEVKQVLSQILVDISGNNTQIQNISATAEEINSSTDQAISQIKTVQKALEKSVDMVTQINQDTDQIAESLGHVVSVVESAAADSESASASSEEVLASLNENQALFKNLTQLVTALSQDLSRFKVS